MAEGGGTWAAEGRREPRTEKYKGKERDLCAAERESQASEATKSAVNPIVPPPPPPGATR